MEPGAFRRGAGRARGSHRGQARIGQFRASELRVPNNRTCIYTTNLSCINEVRFFLAFRAQRGLNWVTPGTHFAGNSRSYTVSSVVHEA